jgi:hypothetical protein
MMLIPNNDYAVLSVADEAELKPGVTFTAKVEAVGQTPFAPQPVGGDGRNFSFARQPDAFPLKKGDEVLCGSFVETFKDGARTLVIVFKDHIYAIIRSEEEEINLFNQEMNADQPLYLKG